MKYILIILLFASCTGDQPADPGPTPEERDTMPVKLVDTLRIINH